MTIHGPSRRPDDERPPTPPQPRQPDPDDNATRPARPAGAGQPGSLYPHPTPPTAGGPQIYRPGAGAAPPSAGQVIAPGHGQAPAYGPGQQPRVPAQPPPHGQPPVQPPAQGRPPAHGLQPTAPGQPTAGHPAPAYGQQPQPPGRPGGGAATTPVFGAAAAVAPPEAARPAPHAAQVMPRPAVAVQPAVAPPAAVTQPGHPLAQVQPAPVAQPAVQPAVQPVAAPVPLDTAATSRIGAPAVVGNRTAEQATQAAAASVAYAAPTAPATAPRPARTPSPTPPHQGTIYGTGRDENGNGRVGSRRALPTLKVGAHTASDGALALLGMPMPGAGMVLGYDLDSATASIRLFRPEPTRVALVGGEWAFHLLAMRALALGARVAVFTSTPERWNGFGEWATGRTGRVATFPPDQSVIVPASAHEPALLLYDVGLTGAPSTTPLGPWQTRLTVLRQLTTYGVPTLQESSVVMTQRLARAEADLIASTMRLSSEASAWMQTLPDDGLAILVGGEERFVRLTLADVEKQLGAPQR